MSYVPPALRARGDAQPRRRDAPAVVDVPTGEQEGWIPSIRQPFGPPTTGEAGFVDGYERKPAVPTPEQVAEFKESFKKRQETRADNLSNMNKAIEKENAARNATRLTKAQQRKASELKLPNNSSLVFFQNVAKDPSGEWEVSPWSWWHHDRGGPEIADLASVATRKDVSEDQFIEVWKSVVKSKRPSPSPTPPPEAAAGEDGDGRGLTAVSQEGRDDQTPEGQAGDSSTAESPTPNALTGEGTPGGAGTTRPSAPASAPATSEVETEENVRRAYRAWQRARKEEDEQRKPSLVLLCNLWDHGHQPLFVNTPPPGLIENQSAAAARVRNSFKNNRQNDFFWRPMRGVRGSDAAAVDSTGIGAGSREDDVDLVRLVDDPLAEATSGEFWVKSYNHCVLPRAFQVPWILARIQMQVSLLEQYTRGPDNKLLFDRRRDLADFAARYKNHPLIGLADQMFSRTWYFNNVVNDASMLTGLDGAVNFNRPIPFFGQHVNFSNSNKPGDTTATKGSGTFLGWYRITSVKYVPPESDELRSMLRLRFGRRGNRSGLDRFWARFGVAQIPKAQWPFPYPSPSAGINVGAEADRSINTPDMYPPSADTGAAAPASTDIQGDDAPSTQPVAPLPASGQTQGQSNRKARGGGPRTLHLPHPRKFESLAQLENFEMFAAGLGSQVIPQNSTDSGSIAVGDRTLEAGPPQTKKNNGKARRRRLPTGDNSPAGTPDEESSFVRGAREPEQDGTPRAQSQA